MVKKVNVYPTSPVITLDIPLRTRMLGINMDTEDIRKCIIAQAIVEEVLPTGDIVNLNFTNYDKDNNITIVKEEEQKPEPQVENESTFKPIDFKNLSRKERKKLNRMQQQNTINNTTAVQTQKEELEVEESPVVEEPNVEEVKETEVTEATEVIEEVETVDEATETEKSVEE